MAELTAPEPIKKREITLQIVTPTRGGGGGIVGTSGSFEVLSGAHFRYSFEVPPMVTLDALKVRAWLHACRGQGNYSLLKTPPTETSRTGSTTTTASAAEDDTTIAVDDASKASVGNTMVLGSTASAANFVQVCRITGVSGSTITFEPPLRAAFSSGGVVAFGEALARWRLVGATPTIPLRPLRSEPFQIELEEVI